MFGPVIILSQPNSRLNKPTFWDRSLFRRSLQNNNIDPPMFNFFLHVCVATYVSIRSNFKPDSIFFLRTQNTAVIFVLMVNNFKPDITFGYLVIEVKSHHVAKLNPLLRQVATVFKTSPPLEKTYFTQTNSKTL